MSKFWQEFWRLLGSKLRMSTAHHPQTDGQTEAMNRVVEMILRCTLYESGEVTHWECYLTIAKFVVNNSVSQATGYMPFFLNYGYEPCIPMDFLQDCDDTNIESVTTFLT